MPSKQLSITVRGTHKTWSFEFLGNPRYLAEWRADGLVIEEIVNTIPVWIPVRFVRLWCGLQDVFHLRWWDQ